MLATDAPANDASESTHWARLERERLVREEARERRYEARFAQIERNARLQRLLMWALVAFWIVICWVGTLLRAVR